jgi:2-polyprenyl-3-methyl-5-hydroxy-6-metoxy-1,4-benzoquinol methylase
MNLEKEKTYYQKTRTDLLSLVPKEKKLAHVLEVGCGIGSTGFSLKQGNKSARVYGIEINEKLKAEAEKNLDEVIIGDIEKIDLPFEEEYFDCIIFADVLEHLYDPWFVLKKIKPFLKPGGFVLASIPNVQHWSIVFNLIRGKWEYRNEGILDNTHIRFFTKRAVLKMFDGAGFEIININRSMGRIIGFINTMSFRLFNNFFSFRYLVLTKKKM